MARYPAASLAQSVILFFARNHEEEMTVVDISVKFDTPLRYVNKRLKRSLRDGMLIRTSEGPGRGLSSVYTAGPQLLTLIGERRGEPDRRSHPRPEPDRRAVPQACANLARA